MMNTLTCTAYCIIISNTTTDFHSLPPPTTMPASSLPNCCIVGSGIAGLSAAFLAKQSGKFGSVTIFERELILGMDAHSVNTTIRGEEIRLDTPPRAFSAGFYPNLMSMYELAGIEIEPFSWAWSVSALDEPRAMLKMGGQSLFGFRIPETNGATWKSLFSSQTRAIISDTLRFHRAMKQIMDGTDRNSGLLSTGEFLTQGAYSDVFIYEALLPILSMVCTCTYKSCLEYPMELVADYFTKNSSSGQYHSRYGSSDVVQKLSSGCQIRTGCPVLGIWHSNPERGETKAKVRWIEQDGTEQEALFDAVIVASQAHTALRLVSDLSPEETDVLSRFSFEYTTVSVHRDPKLMPTDRRDWLPMNVILPRKGDRRRESMFTMWCSAASKHWEDKTELAPLFQTWNPILDPSPNLEMKRIVFERPVVKLATLKAMEQLEQMQGRGGIYFCGAYALRAIPLQENGTACARLVGEKMGITCPWTHLTEVREDRTRKIETTRRKRVVMGITFGVLLCLIWLR